VQGVTTREIVEAAEQRNPSAVSYHFGSRQNLLRQILARRGAPVDEQRGELRDQAGPRPVTRALVACLVEPYAALLDSEGGRSYVRIVAQLRGRFAAWRVESDAATTKHLARILDEIESRPDAPAAVRRERVVALIMLLTGAVAERARRIDDGTGNELDHDQFVGNLVDMCTAVVAA
jgi:TetR/AcrR family transcriptional regulator, regulator of cefoperazone and chloramphenicol sensitivity